jgi:FixJ family two-component response regulator
MALTKTQKAARAAFVQIYGREARNVVSYIARGWNSVRIADKFNVPVTSVAAYRANVSRGTYYPFINENASSGSCNW